MSIETGQPIPTTPVDAVPTIEQQDVFTAALPTLNAIRRKNEVATAQFPPNHDTLPGQSVVVEPYYDFKGDRDDMGHWGISTKETTEDGVTTSFRAMVSAQPDFKVKVLGGEKTTEADVQKVVNVLGIMAAGQEVAPQSAQRAAKEKGVARWLGRRSTHRPR
jgi:hypothetical protein